jgi:hypothetical protein
LSSSIDRLLYGGQPEHLAHAGARYLGVHIVPPGEVLHLRFEVVRVDGRSRSTVFGRGSGSAGATFELRAHATYRTPEHGSGRGGFAILLERFCARKRLHRRKALANLLQGFCDALGSCTLCTAAQGPRHDAARNLTGGGPQQPPNTGDKPVGNTFNRRLRRGREQGAPRLLLGEGFLPASRRTVHVGPDEHRRADRRSTEKGPGGCPYWYASHRRRRSGSSGSSASSTPRQRGGHLRRTLR